MEFYKKDSNVVVPEGTDILNFLSGNTRLNMAWDLVKSGVNANEAFKLTTLDDFLKDNKKSSDDSANITVVKATKKEIKEKRKQKAKELNYHEYGSGTVYI